MGQPREGTWPGRVELTEESDDHAMVRTADESGTDILALSVRLCS